MPQTVNIKYIRKVTWTGLFVNLALSMLKFAAGFWGHSQAVIADALHSFSDSTTDIAVIIGSYFWSKPPDDTHQHGHHRVETIVTFFIGFILLLAGIGIGWNAIITLHEMDTRPPGWIAAMAAAISIIVKEIIYRWTSRASKRVKSTALAANAWHHRLDAISSIPTLIAVTGAILMPEWSFLDHAGAIIVSIFIVQAAIRILWPIFRGILDVAAPEEICKQIEAICLDHEAVKEVHKIRTRHIGMNLQADLHIIVDSSTTVFDGHHISGGVKDKILKNVPAVIDVLIHIEPLEDKPLHNQQ
jgi:cation diffusion facilitator family transporter